MRITLAYPPCLYERALAEDAGVVPMGLHYLGAALLAAGHQASQINLAALPRDQWEAALAQARPQVLGLSVFSANRLAALEAAALAKRLDPACAIVLGGPGATFLWEHLLARHSQVDYVVRGEGEQTLAELADALAQGRDPGGVAGLCLRREGRPHANPARPFIEPLDSLPNPAEHFAFQHVALSRGCPEACGYCGSPRLWARRVRFHSAGYFVRMLELQRARGQRFFFFSDDTFTLRRELALEVCALITQRLPDITWQAISRVERVDAELLRAMRRAGCVQISYGLESGSQAVRQALRRRLDEAAAVRACRETARQGILPRAYFIYGSPGETDETIEQSLELLRRARPLAALFYVLRHYPGTALYDQMARRLGLSDEVWLQPREDIMHCEADEAMSEARVEAWGKRLRQAFLTELPGFLREMELSDEPGMAPLHAEFLARLGATLLWGDYAREPGLAGREALAGELFARALAYAPARQALLGLGVLAQGRREFEQSLEYLDKGLAAHPGDLNLTLCRAGSLLNLGRAAEALAALEPLAGRAEAWPLLAQAHAALGDSAQAGHFRRLAANQGG